jgi:hypothetical protein
MYEIAPVDLIRQGDFDFRDEAASRAGEAAAEGAGRLPARGWDGYR